MDSERMTLSDKDDLEFTYEKLDKLEQARVNLITLLVDNQKELNDTQKRLEELKMRMT